jgi:formate dehydrogenase subunit gamma
MTANSEAARAQVHAVCDRYRQSEGALLPILHDVQEHFGHVPGEAVPWIAEALNLSRAEVHGVVSFYHDFHDQPPAGPVLKVCRAEACQAVDGRAVWAAAEAAAEGTAVEVKPVYCLGNCACAPAAQVGGRTVGRLDVTRVRSLVGRLAKGDA